MKTKRLNYRLLILCITAGAFLSSCDNGNPCADEKPATHTPYKLSAGAKTNVPFRADGLDTLTYISNLGDTSILYGQAVKTYDATIPVNRNANPDCPFFDYKYDETVEYNFIGVGALKRIIFKMYGSAQGDESADFIVNQTWSYRDNGGTPLRRINNAINYTETVIINGAEKKGAMVYSTNNVKDSMLIYNNTDGILKLYSSNKTWILHH